MRKVLLTLIAGCTFAALGVAQETPPTPPKPPRPPKVKMHTMPMPAIAGSGSYLGIDSRDVTTDRVAPLKLKNESGVEVVMVDQDAPAGKAGLKEHDVILSFNGQAVESVEQLRRMIKETPPGRSVALGISRDGQQQNVNVQLANRQEMVRVWDKDQVIHIPQIEIPAMPDIEVPAFEMLQYSRRNGLMVENLTPQLGAFFGCKEGRGVLVRSVEKGSLAEASGFKAGDVILRVGTEPVEDMQDWSRIMRKQNSGKVSVTILRDKREQNLAMAIPERKRSSNTIVLPDLDDVTVELAQVGPMVQQALNGADATVMNLRNSKELQQEMDKARKEWKQNQKQLQKEMEQMRKEMEKAFSEAEEE